ncbi:unnamed protein product [Urochloa decumbens]|uniref:Cullin N-terminal domain-containing protein n=1 Tax=Urochloa decumbens TaxID=240449 RepID=A0ABC9EMY2_9POAL
MENGNELTGRRMFKIQAFKHGGTSTIDPETVAITCKAVTQTICELYAQGNISMSFEDLYRGAYNMILHKKGEELYSVVETTMTSEVQSLCRPLDAAPADGAAFLQELLAKWNQHIKAVNMIRDMLMYMDRTYVFTNHKTPIKELGLRLWREHMIHSDKIRERLVDAVKQQRGGEDELIAGVNKMLEELGEDVPGLFFPDGELHDAAGP